jgi:ABC-2 type transport system ATP-binding protein
MSVRIQNLTKYFGQTKAVDNLSFEVKNGEIIGFLGPNGAGKTTTARLITGYLAPSNGIVEVNGKDVRKFPYEVRRMIGYLPEENPLYPDMDVFDYLSLIAQLQGVQKTKISGRIREMVTLFGLKDVLHLDISKLSKGFRQRVGIAQAMIHDPSVLILDEPTNGLDPNQVMEFRSIIKQLKEEKTVILSTHALAEVQALCSRIIILGQGKKLADDTVPNLQKKFKDKDKFFVEVEKSTTVTFDTVQSALESLSDVLALSTISEDNETNNTVKFFIWSQKGIDIRKLIVNLCVEKQMTLLDLHLQYTSIEDIFHLLTTEKKSQ